MSKKELLSGIVKELKKTTAKIKKQTDGRDLENPIDIDIVKSLKANFYETSLELFKQYISEEEE